ncbi:hypothetical protein H5410_014662 [Solanum commersonii]|uniref:Ubiquitin-like protease family profile domain-containing protein n=1 Tax=Solanum commersonii TaxID=4109 RepID=A0A9J5ZRK7_SOLCO|nr:hypothetical protein H5410_014662 [Solanum commersonii]
MSRQATRPQSSKINNVKKHSDTGTSHTNKHVEQKSVQDTMEMAQSKKSSGITISRDEFEAFKKLGDKLKDPNQDTALLDQDMLDANVEDQRDNALFDQVMLDATVEVQHNARKEYEIRSNIHVHFDDKYTARSDELIEDAREAPLATAPIQMIYMPNSNLDKVVTETHAELSDHLFPSSLSQHLVIFYLKHLFVSLSNEEEDDLFRKFWKWLKEDLLVKHYKKNYSEDRYKKGKTILPNLINFGVATIDDKNWFYNIGFERHLIDNSEKGLNISTHPRYQGHTLYDFFDIVYVEDIPQQPDDSLDCGVYVAAYAEFLSDGKDIPAYLDPEEVRIIYASLLRNYNIQKLQAGAVSDSEVPLKPVRNRTENNSTERLQCSSFLPYS